MPEEGKQNKGRRAESLRTLISSVRNLCGKKNGIGLLLPKHDFQYIESIVGVHTKIIAVFSSTSDHSIGELTLFPSAMAQAYLNCPQMETVLGDSLYASRKACKLVASYGAKSYFLPRSNSTFRSHGVAS